MRLLPDPGFHVDLHPLELSFHPADEQRGREQAEHRTRKGPEAQLEVLEHTHRQQNRQQEAHRPPHVAEEARHGDPTIHCHSPHHEVGAVANVSEGAPQNGAQADGSQQRLVHAGHQHTTELSTQALRHLEEDGVGGGVVQQGTEDAREQVEGVLIQRKRRGNLFQRLERGNHGQENPHEQVRHLADGAERELVQLPRGGVAKVVGPHGRPQHDQLPGRRGQERHRQHDRRQADQASPAHQPQRLDLALVPPDVPCRLRVVHDLVNPPVHVQQGAVGEQPVRPELEGPPERNPAQHAQEQRRVTERREQSAGVGHHEDGKHHSVRHELALAVGVEQRPDQEHARPGRTDQRRQQRTHGQEGHVRLGMRRDVAGQEDPAAHHEQAPQEQDELRVLRQGVHHRVVFTPHPQPSGHRDPQPQTQLELIGRLLPPVLRQAQQRKAGHGQQEPQKGHHSIPRNIHDPHLAFFRIGREKIDFRRAKKRPACLAGDAFYHIAIAGSR